MAKDFTSDESVFLRMLCLLTAVSEFTFHSQVSICHIKVYVTNTRINPNYSNSVSKDETLLLIAALTTAFIFA